MEGQVITCFNFRYALNSKGAYRGRLYWAHLVQNGCQSIMGDPNSLVVSRFGRPDYVVTLDEIGAQDRLVEP